MTRQNKTNDSHSTKFCKKVLVSVTISSTTTVAIATRASVPTIAIPTRITISTTVGTSSGFRSGVLLQRLQYLLGNWRWRGQMVAFGHETIFVSGVLDRDFLAIGSCVREGTDSGLRLVISTGIFQLALFFRFYSVASFVAEFAII